MALSANRDLTLYSQLYTSQSEIVMVGKLGQAGAIGVSPAMVGAGAEALRRLMGEGIGFKTPIAGIKEIVEGVLIAALAARIDPSWPARQTSP